MASHAHAQATAQTRPPSSRAMDTAATTDNPTTGPNAPTLADAAFAQGPRAGASSPLPDPSLSLGPVAGARPRSRLPTVAWVCDDGATGASDGGRGGGRCFVCSSCRCLSWMLLLPLSKALCCDRDSIRKQTGRQPKEKS